MDGIVMLGDYINKIIEVTQERKKEREKVIGAQLEISRLNLKAAKKQKKIKVAGSLYFFAGSRYKLCVRRSQVETGEDTGEDGEEVIWHC